MRILRHLFKCDDEFSPLSLMHFTPRDQHREVFLAHSIYHHIKHEHLESVINLTNFADIVEVMNIAISFGKSLIEHEFPVLYRELYGYIAPDAFVVSS